MKSLSVKVAMYLAAFVLANFIVLWMGPAGLVITALFLVPFDFVMRCFFHETMTGWRLVAWLFCLVSAAAGITIAINYRTLDIALASVVGFTCAQVAASLFYQANLRRPYWLKVNGSDLVGIAFDSLVFQAVAFGVVSWSVFAGQTAMKFAGGLAWYWLLFVRLKIQDHVHDH